MVKQIDKRLAALGTDYIDLLFFHGLGGHQVDWPKSKEMKEAAEAIKKTGKVKFVGFTTHDARRPEQLQSAAEGGFIDVIMLQFSPWLDRDAPLNRAIDACHKQNIGIVSMKQMAGHTQALNKLPVLKERGLNSHQGLLTAIWSDERISATCVTMMNTDQVNQNTDAARKFEPLKQAEIHQLRDAVLAAGPRVRRLRRPLRPRRRHQGPARRPDAVPHLPRAPRLAPPGPRGLRRALRGRAQLARRRPRGRHEACPASSTSPSSSPRSIACWAEADERIRPPQVTPCVTCGPGLLDLEMGCRCHGDLPARADRPDRPAHPGADTPRNGLTLPRGARRESARAWPAASFVGSSVFPK